MAVREDMGSARELYRGRRLCCCQTEYRGNAEVGDDLFPREHGK